MIETDRVVHSGKAIFAARGKDEGIRGSLYNSRSHLQLESNTLYPEKMLLHGRHEQVHYALLRQNRRIFERHGCCIFLSVRGAMLSHFALFSLATPRRKHDAMKGYGLTCLGQGL